jgi:hypothetical protein
MSVKIKDSEWEIFPIEKLSSVGFCACGSVELFTHEKDVPAFFSVKCQPSICK